MTVADIARAAGLSQSHLSEAMNWGTGLSSEAVDRLAAVLKCRRGTIAPTLIQPRRFLPCKAA
jgi:hypothetical protein